MNSKAIKLGLFLLGLVILQQGIALGTHHVGQLKAQSRVVQENDLDPSALFYMEIDLALAAEKTVRNRLKK